MDNQLGEKIKKIREFKMVSLEELSEKSGLSLQFISDLEAGKTVTSLGPLMKIARALGMRLGTILDDNQSQGPVITKKSQNININRFASKEQSNSSDLIFKSLAHDKAERHMDPFIIDIKSSSADNYKLSSHEGEEFIYVISGTVEIIYGKEIYILEAGDSIYYDSIVSHSVHSAKGCDAQILAVVYSI